MIHMHKPRGLNQFYNTMSSPFSSKFATFDENFCYMEEISFTTSYIKLRFKILYKILRVYVFNIFLFFYITISR